MTDRPTVIPSARNESPPSGSWPPEAPDAATPAPARRLRLPTCISGAAVASALAALAAGALAAPAPQEQPPQSPAPSASAPPAVPPEPTAAPGPEPPPAGSAPREPALPSQEGEAPGAPSAASAQPEPPAATPEPPSSPVSPLPVDTVVLADGGRVRGQVMEEHPARGVRVRLADGTVREIPSHEVDHVEYGDAGGPAGRKAPAPKGAPSGAATERTAPRRPTKPRPGATTRSPPRKTPPTGSARVASGEPGHLFVDGRPIGPVGIEPVVVPHLAVGPHEISVAFDEGDRTTLSIEVAAEEPVEAIVEPPGARHGFRHREGLRFGIGAAGSYVYRPWRFADARPIEPEIGIVEHGGGGSLEGVISWGLSPLVDLRLVPRVMLASLPLERTFAGTATDAVSTVPYVTDGNPQLSSFSIVPSALVAVRLNWTSVYSMMIGLRAGAEIFTASESSAAGESADQTIRYDGQLSPRASVLGHWGPEISVLSFRLGAKREMEIELAQGLLIDTAPSLQIGLAARYLLLP